MRLRPALMTCVIAALAIVGLRLTSLFVEWKFAARNDAQRETIEVIARDAAGLLVLTQDYGLHQSERAARQWGLVQARLSRALAGYAAFDPASADQVDELQNTARTLPQIFAALRRATALDDLDAPARRETLTDQLVNETRRVSDGAFDLSRSLLEQRRVDAEHQLWLAVATQLALLAATLLLAGLLLRRVLAPIDRLRGVAQAVEGGALSARSALPGDDELGQLSQALDAMTGALQQRDAALRESNRQLERNEAFLQRAGQMAGVGGWKLDLATGRLGWTAQTYVIHEQPAGSEPNAEALLRSFVPESEQRLRDAMARAADTGEGWDLELQLLTPSHELRWLNSVGAAEREPADGPVARLVGAVQDVTERRAVADTLRRASEAADAANAAEAPSSDDWPEIDGIVRDEARQHLKGNPAFFAQLLARLFEEFGDLGREPAQPAQPLDGGRELAARLHKLSGSAGMLGAQALCMAARRAETAWRAGGPAPGTDDDGLAEVRVSMRALAASAGPWLARREAARQPAPAAPAPPPDPQALARLREALQASNLLALELFTPLAPALRAACGAADFDRLQAALQRLDFKAALGMLDARLP